VSDPTEDLAHRLERFVRDRGWEQFHDPKNLSMAVAGEAGELVALYQWLDGNEATRQSELPPLRDRVREEMADVFIYLLFLANAVGVDLMRVSRS
jgi:NTP pyrophosphatase (non-canonical NTP hydrolase)